MERVSELMTFHYHWGGVWRRLLVFSILIVLLAVFFITPAISQTFDVLIIEKPRYLTAYDDFQQSLASSQLAALQPFIPMKIINSHDILSDGLTNCMKVDINGNTFFLLKDDNGKLVGWNKLGTVKIYKNREYLQDTILILVSNKIVFQKYANGNRSNLAAGDRCISYFEHDGSTYVKRIRKESAFGWIKTQRNEEGSLWKVVHMTAVRSEFSPALRERICGRVQQANRTLAQIYYMLNMESGKRLTAPQWNEDRQAGSLSFILIPESAVNTYPKSIEILKTSLQTYLLGTNYNVAATGNKIEIIPR